MTNTRNPEEGGRSKGQKADDEMKNILSAYNEQAKGSSLVDFANGWNAAKRYAQQREQPWVRVEPGCEMPEAGIQAVLIWIEKEEYPSIGHYWIDNDIKNAYWTNDSMYGQHRIHLYENKVTHWQKLPPAPPKD